jgi:hypothetical protein
LPVIAGRPTKMNWFPSFSDISLAYSLIWIRLRRGYIRMIKCIVNPICKLSSSSRLQKRCPPGLHNGNRAAE